MSYQMPDRISTEVNVQQRVRAVSATFEFTVTGASATSNTTTIKKSKDLAAIRTLMESCAVPDEKLKIVSVSFKTSDGWLSGSTVDIELEASEIPIDRCAEALAQLSTMKNVKLDGIYWNYGDLGEIREALLRKAIIQSKQQAALIAEAAGVPLISIYLMSPKWSEPERSAMEDRYHASSSRARLSKSAAPSREEYEGYQLLQNQEGSLWLQIKMDFRVGEFL